MEYFPVPNFKPGETKEDATDQDRGVLRICEGLLPYPQGALCAGPEWKLMWGKNALGADIATALAGADTGKAHFVKITKNGHTFLVCWSLQASRALGFFYVGGSNSNSDLDATGSVVITATSGSVYRDKDPTAEWFASPIDGRILLGNGVATDANLIWESNALAIFGPSATPADVNLRSRVRIPPCKVFRLHVNGSLFAAGNATNPLRVWITDPPNVGEPWMSGVYSLQTCFMDIPAHGGATRINGLSVFQQYVTAHTDAKPINLYGVDQTQDGYKCQSSPSAANASAINPNCSSDVHGDASFYLGTDLEVYFDQAIRSGPFEKKGSRDQDIATIQASGVWNSQAKTPILTYGYHVVYDRDNRLFWMFMPNALDNRPALFCYNERTRTVAGPWRFPAAIVSTVVKSLGASVVAVITASGELLYARLNAIGELPQEQVEAPGTVLGAAYDAAGSAPTPVVGVPYVAMTADNATIIETAAGSSVGLATMWSQMATLVPGGYTLTQYFNNAYLARFESPWMHLGNPKQLKNFHEIQMTIERDARACIGIFAETDSGRRSGKWYGQVHGNNVVRVPLTLAGRKIRVRVVAVVFNAGRCLIRDLQIGFSMGGFD